jgi:hypothetical protein
METKICSKCNIEKESPEFNMNGNKLSSICKLCKKEYDKQYRAKNAERIKEREKNNYKELRKEYREKNKEQLKVKRLQYNQENKELIKETKKRYRQKHKEDIAMYMSNYRKNRKENDTLYKLKHCISTLIRQTLKKKGFNKNSRTHEILGCSVEEFKTHLENQFESWMTWDNYGLYNGTENYGWDIDHIKPSSSAITEEDVIKLNHYTNLKPLCSYVNRYVKKDRLK